MGSYNFIEKYELIDGWAIVNNNFKIVTANENYYRFVGISRSYMLTDVIHQVDLDDFVEISNSLKANASKSIVIRMRRVDNSYRWMLVEVKREELYNKGKSSGEEGIFEYLELKISDVQVLQDRNRILKQQIREYGRLLTSGGELLFTIDYRKRDLTFYRQVNGEMAVVSERPIAEMEERYERLISSQDGAADAFLSLCSDIKEGAASFVHNINVTDETIFDGILEKGSYEIKACTYHENGKKSRITGTIGRTGAKATVSSDMLNGGADRFCHTDKDVLSYVRNHIEANPSGEIMLLLLQIDTLDDIRERFGENTAAKTFERILSMCRDKTGDRGIIGVNKDNIIYMAIKDINIEIYARAFIESLKTKIIWDYKTIDGDISLTFSIGVSRYPFNGKDYDKMVLKAKKALEIANIKGRNRFIIYKEQMHGEI